jgi:hypothetical protein
MGRSYTNIGMNIKQPDFDENRNTIDNHNPLLDDTEDYRAGKRQSFGL